MKLDALSPAELDLAVRALLWLPEAMWPAAADHLIRTTALAAIVAAAAGRSHPALGNGTLMATLSRWPMVSPAETDAGRQARALGILSRAVSRVCSSGSAAGSGRS